MRLIWIVLVVMIISGCSSDLPAGPTPETPAPETGESPAVDDTIVAAGNEACAESPAVEAYAGQVSAWFDGDNTTYCLGEQLLAGGIESATAVFDGNGGWNVDLVFSESGITFFNQAAAECFEHTPRCPIGRLAIVAGSEVLLAPAINAPSYAPDAIVLSGILDQAGSIALSERVNAEPEAISFLPVIDTPKL